ncbi:patatin-like phospholipase family protein [Terrimonas alba]|uniref:patatin-like phospholipase family protein n=1 Tax=Terrimonas alba TaxID=3349636 RepID=UPI0035F29BAB
MQAKKLLPNQVNYLAFEGGGFKGIAYVGAIKALESEALQILDRPGPPPDSYQGSVPQVDPRDRNKKINGFAGTSIGAFTAYLLTLGHDSETIKDILIPSKNSSKKSLVERVFEKEAKKNIFRGVKKNTFSEISSDKINPDYYLYKSRQQILKQEGLASNIPLSLLSDSGVLTAAMALGPFIYSAIKALNLKGFIGKSESEDFFDNDLDGFVKDAAKGSLIETGTLLILNAILRTALMAFMRKKLTAQKADPKFIEVIIDDNAFDGFLYNLLFDGGAFTGFGLRNVVQEILKEYLDKSHQRNLKELVEIDKTYNDLKIQVKDDSKSYDEREKIWQKITNRVTFEQLHKLTGKILTVVGVNLRTQAPFYFDCKRTPHFPVIDAVSISMNFPFIFKPVIVDGSEPNLNGYWTDGGLVNNTPIHAFDNAEATDAEINTAGYRDTANANEKVLCFRLKEGAPKLDDVLDNPLLAQIARMFTGKIDIEKKDPSAITIFDMTADLAGSAMTAPAEEGQFRTENERAQSLDLFSFSIELMTIEPEEELVNIVSQWSEIFTLKYFDRAQNAAQLVTKLQQDILKLKPKPKPPKPVLDLSTPIM